MTQMLESTETNDDVFASSLTLTAAQVASSGWTGSAITDFGAVVVTVFECPSNKGYFHCVVIGRTVTETKRPVIAVAVGVTLDYFLATFHQCKAGDIRWRKTQLQPERLDQKLSANPQEIVYFLRAGEFIKIGKSTHSGRRRIAELQTGCPYPISLIAEIQGGLREEAALHRRFAHIRAHGEWFHATTDLLAHIEEITVAV
jgi:hypothetical protein